MKPYEYPKVPASSQLQRPHELVATVPERDNRFSWMQTPADAERRMWRDTTHSPAVPPLPQIPDHLNAGGETQNHSMVDNPEQQTQAQAPVEQPYRMDTSMSSGYAVQPAHSITTQSIQSQQYAQNPQYTYSTHSVQRQQTPQTPLDTSSTQSVQSQQYPHNPHYTYSTQSVQSQQPHNPQHSDSTQAASDSEPEYRMPVAPDVNPLTPASPTKAKSRSETTNMVILPPPTSPSHFPISNFTPVPQPLRGGSWQHGFCSCSEPAICMTALFCPCIVYGKTQYRLGLRSQKQDPTNMLGYSAINGSCLAFGILCGINGILAAIQHTRLRRAYEMDGMAGNIADDCATGICCCCCTVAQDEKEIKFREEEARKAGRHGANEGYAAPTHMMFAAPPR